jgi:hypothetical protein
MRFALRAEMMRRFGPRQVYKKQFFTVHDTDRCDPLLAVLPAGVDLFDYGPSKIRIAWSKSTPCLARFLAFFAASHSNGIHVVTIVCTSLRSFNRDAGFFISVARPAFRSFYFTARARHSFINAASSSGERP